MERNYVIAPALKFVHPHTRIACNYKGLFLRIQALFGPDQ
ncbi:hypothetical protein AGMMS50243_29070 [Betaproteobacteria bacterium]|nr:hypothetical protein AGMMS50243_29070 [Betaproteobacteria bacterium]